MSAGPVTTILPGGSGLPVEVGAIAQELRRLWEAAAEPGEDGRPAVMRACTRNLVVLVADRDAAGRASAAVAEVAAEHPARAFIVVAVDAGAPDHLAAFLTAHCWLRDGGRHVCCEQVVLEVGAAARQRAAGVIVPLLVPDLPVFTWVDTPLLWTDPLLSRMLDVTDRLVVDGRRQPGPERLVAALSSGQRHDRWAPADFEWARLAPWREAVATLFDEPTMAQAAAGLARIEVRYAAPGPPLAAALLAGWILDRLAVLRERGGTGLAERTADGDTVGEEAPLDVRLRADPDGEEGGVTRLAFVGPGGAERVLEVAPGEGALAACGVLAGVPAPPCRVPLVPPNGGGGETARLLAAVLEGRAADPIYERALARAATLLAGVPPE